MKSFLRITSIIFFSAFFFASCDNEPLSEDIELNDSTTPVSGEIIPEELIGQWLIQDYTLITTNILNQQGVEVAIVAESEFASGDQVVTFTDDNQYSAEGEITINVTTSIDGMVIEENTDTTDNFDSGTWSIDGNQLILSDNVTGEFSTTIITLNSQTLVLFLEVDNESLGIPEDDPLFGEVSGQGTITYSKVQ